MTETEYKRFFASRLKEAMARKNMSVVDMTEVLECTRQSIYNLLDAKTMPSVMQVKKLARFFGTTEGWWLS